MKVGLIDVDSKIPNLALMKISAFHKKMGNTVDLIGELEANQYDRIYVSKVFSYTFLPNLPPDAEIGGSGYDLFKGLNDTIEHTMPDYDLYLNMDYSMGFTTRGCMRQCKFCIVPQKEGKIKYNTDIYEFWNPKHRNLILLDNNIFALGGQFERISEQILKEGLKVDFNQGLDIRLLTDDKARILKQLRPMKQWRFAFDSLQYEKAFRRGAELLLKYNISKSLICVYVLAGFDENFEDTLYRVKVIYEEYGFDPFIMLYEDFSGMINTDEFKPLKKWNSFARWVNHKAIFKSVKWENYKG